MGAPQTCDVVVVGAGVFGAWTAYQLCQAGKSVTLIDGYGAGNSRSSSGDESRIIRMGYGGDETYSRSAWRSLQLWKELFAQTGDNLFRKTGVLWLAHEGDPYPVSTFETLTNLSFPIEKLTLAEVSTRYPQFGYEGIGGAFLEPESGVLLARRAVQAVAREALKSGVDYLLDSVEPPNARRFDEVVTTGGERISAAVYVFACGAWLPKVFPDVLAGRIHPTRQDVFYLGAPGTRFQSPALPVWVDFKTEAYGLPDIEGRGVKVAIDRHGEAFDPDTNDRVVSSESLAEVRRYLARRVPELQNAPVNETRVCQYENTSNGDFLIDRHPQFENVWLVGGGSGHGFKHGPFVGEYAAARIEGRVEGIEPRFGFETKLRAQKRMVY